MYVLLLQHVARKALYPHTSKYIPSKTRKTEIAPGKLCIIKMVFNKPLECSNKKIHKFGRRGKRRFYTPAKTSLMICIDIFLKHVALNV